MLKRQCRYALQRHVMSGHSQRYIAACWRVSQMTISRWMRQAGIIPAGHAHPTARQRRREAVALVWRIRRAKQGVLPC